LTPEPHHDNHELLSARIGITASSATAQSQVNRITTGGPLKSVAKVDRMIRWHYTTTILRLRIGARLVRYRNCKFHNFARTISRHADGISRYSVPPSAGPLLPLYKVNVSRIFITCQTTSWHSIMLKVTWRRFDQSAKQLVVGRTTTTAAAANCSHSRLANISLSFIPT